MTSSNRPKILLTLAAMAMVAFTTAVQAATITTSATAPTVDGLDIASLPIAGTSPGSKYWIWDGDSPGQSWTMGAEGGNLNAITMRVWETSNATANKTHDFWIGEISGSSYVGTPNNVVATQTTDWNSNDYVTFALDTPMALEAGKTYGFDMVMTQSDEGWQSGIPYLHTSGGDLYSGGGKLSTGVAGPTAHATNFNGPHASTDMVFHLDIASAAVETVPEPASIAIWSILGLCLAGYGYRRRVVSK